MLQGLPGSMLESGRSGRTWKRKRSTCNAKAGSGTDAGYVSCRIVSLAPEEAGGEDTEDEHYEWGGRECRPLIRQRKRTA